MKVALSPKPLPIKTVMGTPGPSGPPGTTTLNNMSDVDVANLTDGSLLIYDTASSKWVANTLLTAQFIECGEF